MQVHRQPIPCPRIFAPDGRSAVLLVVERGRAKEHSAGEREGAPLARREQREGAPLARREQREGYPSQWKTEAEGAACGHW